MYWQVGKKKNSNVPSGLFFQHAGHRFVVFVSDAKLTLCIHASIFAMHFIIHAVHLGRDKIVDFHWNSSDPWTIVSVSDDGESTGGGGTLQVHLFLAILQTSDFIREISICIFIVNWSY